jgi:hypothetical protein
MRFRKRPIEIEAMQYRGTFSPEIEDFLEGSVHRFDPTAGIRIATLEGVMLAEQYDWIVRGAKGEFYPVKPDIFDATYEAVT